MRLEGESSCCVHRLPLCSRFIYCVYEIFNAYGYTRELIRVATRPSLRPSAYTPREATGASPNWPCALVTSYEMINPLPSPGIGVSALVPL